MFDRVIIWIESKINDYIDSYRDKIIIIVKNVIFVVSDWDEFKNILNNKVVIIL